MTTPSEPLGIAVAAALREPRNADDRWLREAAAAAGARHLAGFGKGIASDTSPLPASAGEAIRIIATHYASATPDNVVGAITSLVKYADSTAAAVLDGLVAGWPDKSKPNLTADDNAALDTAMRTLSKVSRDRLLVLVQKWGLLDNFKDQVAAATQSLREQLVNHSLDDPSRLTAARNLIRLADEPGTARAVLEALTPQATPTLARGLISTLGESKQAETGGALLSQWKRLTPAQKRAGVATLLRRSEWTGTLLDALAAGEVLRGDLGPEHWQQLRSSGNATIAARARELNNGGKVIATDREEVVKKLLHIANQPGDLARGKEVFTANCVVCHKFNGTGAGIGPELTGIGARPRADILAEILDPNRSVEANYRLWNVTTKAGDTFAGRLDGETQTSIELLDLTGQKHTLSRKDITSLESSNLSIMPVGFESLDEKDLAALLEYLAQSTHK